MKQVIGWGVFVLVALGVYLVAGPMALGGPVSYVMVDGASMEPTYQHGDLVIAREQRSYEVGDIVVYDAPVDHQYHVIHRIVDEVEGGFVTQGDNMAGRDAWLVPHDVIYGRALIRVPQGGVVVDVLRRPAIVAAIAGFGTLGLWGSRRRRRRRARRPDARPRSRRRAVREQTSLRGAGPILALLATGVLLLGGATAFMWLQPEERTVMSERTRLEHTGVFGYTASVTPSVIYDSPTLRSPPDGSPAPPIFTSLLRDLRVDFDYTLETVGPAHVEGGLSAHLRVDAGETGWTRTLDLLDPRPFEGTTVSAEFPIDVEAIRSLIATAEAQTGFVPSRYQLAVVARVHLSGEDGGPVDEVFVAELPMELSRTLLTIGETLSASATVTEPEQITVANRIEPFGLSVPVSGGRMVAASALAGLVLIGGTYALTVRRRLGRGPVGWIRLRYGSLIVPVARPLAGAGRPVEVTSISDLVRLARGAEQMIFYDQSTPGQHRFFVPDGAVTYEYRVFYEYRVSTPDQQEAWTWDDGPAFDAAEASNGSDRREPSAEARLRRTQRRSARSGRESIDG
jgi:signal peptidase I